MKVNGIERDYVIHDEKNVKGFFGEYRFLSNYESCKIWYDGLEFGSTEAAYQAAKCVLLDEKAKFVTMTASESKKASKTIMVKPTWHLIRYDVMAFLVFQKFCNDIELRNMLLSTGDRYLEETNWWNDQYWGVCDGKGENHLGKLLMKTRSFWKDTPRGVAAKLFS